eukprot:187309_1
MTHLDQALQSDPTNQGNESKWNEKVEYLSMTSLMYYHMSFHHSIWIHINHAIFCHIYLFGIFLLLTSVHWIANVIGCVLYIILFFFIFKLNIVSWIYAPVVSVIAFTAYWMHQFYFKPSNFSEVSYNQYIPYIFSGSFILFALLNQEIGHLLFELFLPQMSLYHGFIAAPFLEFMTYFILLDCQKLYPISLQGLQAAIQNRREKLIQQRQFNTLYHCCASKRT